VAAAAFVVTAAVVGAAVCVRPAVAVPVEGGRIVEVAASA
jgi:hypothetical protein